MKHTLLKHAIVVVIEVNSKIIEYFIVINVIVKLIEILMEQLIYV
jgi:hypothetical protein